MRESFFLKNRDYFLVNTPNNVAIMVAALKLRSMKGADSAETVINMPGSLSVGISIMLSMIQYIMPPRITTPNALLLVKSNV